MATRELNWKLNLTRGNISLGRLFPLTGNEYTIVLEGGESGVVYEFFLMDDEGRKCLARSSIKDGVYTISFKGQDLIEEFDGIPHEVRVFHLCVSDGENTVAENDLAVGWVPLLNDEEIGVVYLLDDLKTYVQGAKDAAAEARRSMEEIDTKKDDAIQAISTEKNASLEAIDEAKESAIATIDTELNVFSRQFPYWVNTDTVRGYVSCGGVEIKPSDYFKPNHYTKISSVDICFEEANANAINLELYIAGVGSIRSLETHTITKGWNTWSFDKEVARYIQDDTKEISFWFKNASGQTITLKPSVVDAKAGYRTRSPNSNSFAPLVIIVATNPDHILVDEHGVIFLELENNTIKYNREVLTSYTELRSLVSTGRAILKATTTAAIGSSPCLYRPQLMNAEQIRFDATGTIPNGGDKVYTRCIFASKSGTDGISVSSTGLTELAKESDLPTEIALNHNNLRKKEVFKTRWYFNRGGSGLTYDTAVTKMAERYDGIVGKPNPIIGQACAKFTRNGEDYLAVLFFNNGGTLKTGQKAMAVVAVFTWTTGVFAGYFFIEAKDCQSLVVRNEGSAIYAYAVDSDDDLCKFAVPDVFDGRVVVGTKAGLGLKLRDMFAHVGKQWVFLTNSEGSINTPYSRTVVVTDEAFTVLAEYHIPSYRIGFGSNDEMKADPEDQRNFFPHTQGLSLTQDGIVLFQGGFSSNQNSEKGNANCGAIVIGSEGQVVRSSVCRIKEFDEVLATHIGSSVSNSENEGGFVENGRIYCMYLTNANNSGEGFMIRVLEEFSSAIDAADFSIAAWNMPQVEFGGTKELPSIEKTMVGNILYYTITNPITGIRILTFDDIIKYMTLSGVNELRLNTTNTGIISLNGTEIADNDRSIVHIVRSMTKRATNTTVQLFRISLLRYGESHVTEPNSAERNFIVATDGNGNIEGVFEASVSFGQLFVTGKNSAGSTGSVNARIILRVNSADQTGFNISTSDVNTGATSNIASLTISASGNRYMDYGSNDAFRTRIFAGGKHVYFSGTTLEPSETKAITLGSNAYRFKDIILEGGSVESRLAAISSAIADQIVDPNVEKLPSSASLADVINKINEIIGG